MRHVKNSIWQQWVRYVATSCFEWETFNSEIFYNMACLGYISQFTLDVPTYFARSFWMTSSGQQRWFGNNGCHGIFDKIAIRKFEVCTVTTDDLEGLGAWSPAATMINNIGSLWIHSFYWYSLHIEAKTKWPSFPGDIFKCVCLNGNV